MAGSNPTATSDARRVLPTPPGPTTVTSRSLASSRRSAAISESRPRSRWGGEARHRDGSAGQRRPRARPVRRWVRPRSCDDAAAVLVAGSYASAVRPSPCSARIRASTVGSDSGSSARCSVAASTACSGNRRRPGRRGASMCCVSSPAVTPVAERRHRRTRRVASPQRPAPSGGAAVEGRLRGASGGAPELGPGRCLGAESRR